MRGKTRAARRRAGPPAFLGRPFGRICAWPLLHRAHRPWQFPYAFALLADVALGSWVGFYHPVQVPLEGVPGSGAADSDDSDSHVGTDEAVEGLIRSQNKERNRMRQRPLGPNGSISGVFTDVSHVRARMKDRSRNFLSLINYLTSVLLHCCLRLFLAPHLEQLPS